MGKARNKVISGDYKGKLVTCSFGSVSIALSLTKLLNLTSESVEAVVPLDEEVQLSVPSAAIRGFVGEMLLGPIGLVAAASAKQRSIHTVGIQFQDGKRSVLEVDDKTYKAIVTACFKVSS